MKTEARTYFDTKLSHFDDVSKRLFNRVIPTNPNNIRHIHLSGICGTAMGSLAVLLKKAGYEVSGSDEHCYPPMSNVITELGIIFREGFKVENIKDADVIVIGNVCGPDNPEAEYARENNIPTLSLPEAISLFFIKNKKSLVVAGTHGKTTTTGLLSHVFQNAALKPGFMIGGVRQGGEESAVIGEGGYFISEGDEYDTAYFDKSPKFLHYKPNTAIITSLEFDHVDIYKDFEEYRRAFVFLAQELPSDGNLFLWGDDEKVHALAAETEAKVTFYGLGKINDIRAEDIVIEEAGQYFSLIVSNVDRGRFFLPLSGKHNLLNALAVCGVSLSEGLSLPYIQQGLASFSGMKRRQEVVYDKNQITIIDDFAHHPTAVLETISGIKSKFKINEMGRRLVAFFEPRSATSRRKVFETDYGNSFDEADLVFISTPELRNNDDASQFINPDTVVKQINEKGVVASAFKNADDLLVGALPLIQKGDVILIMSNGAFDGIHTKLAQKLDLA